MLLNELAGKRFIESVTLSVSRALLCIIISDHLNSFTIVIVYIDIKPSIVRTQVSLTVLIFNACKADKLEKAVRIYDGF